MTERERERLERAVTELRARYRTMVEEAPEAIVVFDRDEGRFVEVNAAACRLYGLDRETLLRTGPLELSPARQPDGRRSDRVALAHIDAALAGEKPVFEWVHRDAGGRLVPCRVQLARVELEGRQLVRGSVQDLSEWVASARAQARLHRVLEATPDLVSVGDADGHVLWMNEAGRRMIGLDPDEDVTGIDFRTLHPEESGRLLREEAVPHALRHGTWRGETEILARDGRRIPLSQVVIAHFEPDGRVDSLSTVARDVSEQKALERRVLHAHKLESLGVMAGGVAHDFNNLLLGILGNAALLQEDLEPGSEARQEAGQIVHIAERAADLARQLLAYAGRAEVAVEEEVDLSEVARDSAELLAASVSKKVTLRYDLAEALPPVAGDPTQLRQVLMNLVLNAAEAIGERPGEISIRTRAERVDPASLLYSSLEAAEDADGVPCVACEVTDTGPGIPPSVLERIFDPFFSTKAGGRGLGLSALLGIVRSHRGGLAVSSRPGAGARFRLALPARPGTVRRPPPEPERWGFRGQGTVLLADDEAAVRDVCRRALERLGFEVVEAADGRRAVEHLEEDPRRFVAAVVDLTMPGLDGREVLARARALRPDLPVVLASGYAAGRTREADAFLPKPFTPDRLARVLESLLAAPARGRAGRSGQD